MLNPSRLFHRLLHLPASRALNGLPAAMPRPQAPDPHIPGLHVPDPHIPRPHAPRLYSPRLYSTRLYSLRNLIGKCGLVLSAALLFACASPPLAPPLQGEYALLLAAGDIADCRYVAAADSGAQQTALVIEEELRGKPQAWVLTLGDNTYPVGLPAEYAKCFDPTWGRFKQRILPVAGNHEYYTKGAPGYYGYFGSQAGPAGKGYYATTLGSWRVIVLNSALRGTAFADQLTWLQDELRQHPSRCTLAAYHHPAFTSGGHGNNAFMLPLWQALSDAGVDLVLAGHDHHYERFRTMDRHGKPGADGITSFIVGTGGAQFSPLWLPLAGTAERDNSVHGVLRLELHEDAFAWRFLPAQTTSFADAGQGRCR